MSLFFSRTCAVRFELQASQPKVIFHENGKKWNVRGSFADTPSEYQAQLLNAWEHAHLLCSISVHVTRSTHI